MLADLDGTLDCANPRRRILPKQLLHQVDALVRELLLRLDLLHIDRVAHDILEQLVLIIRIVRW